MDNNFGGVIVPIDAERKKLHRNRRIKNDLISYVFLLPFIVGALVFTAFPIVMSVLYSFSNYNGARATQMGFFNYINMFSMGRGGLFLPVMKSFGVTFIYVIASTVINLGLSYILALFLHNKIKGIKIIRVLCYLPCLIPGLASGFIWRDVLSYGVPTAGNPYNGLGLFNMWLTKAGLPTATFFESENTAMLSLLFTGLWGLGGGMIMWLAAFENISPEYYEAARIDGAGYMRCLLKITIPLSTPILFYNMVVSMISGLQVFGTFAAYGTGKNESLYFIAIRIYITAFSGSVHNHGLACAMSWVLFLIIGMLTLVMFKTGNWVQYGDDN